MLRPHSLIPRDGAGCIWTGAGQILNTHSNKSGICMVGVFFFRSPGMLNRSSWLQAMVLDRFLGWQEFYCEKELRVLVFIEELKGR